MGAEDFQPDNRLAVAKRVVRDFIARVAAWSSPDVGGDDDRARPAAAGPAGRRQRDRDLPRHERPGRWLFVLGTGLVLALSAVYEFVEWWAAVILGQGADAFLGTQGDPWDTQWDMFTALIGGTTALLTMTRRHDRQIARLARPGDAPTLAPPLPSRALRNDWKAGGASEWRGAPGE